MVALPLLAAGQRFFAGTNEIQRLIDYDFATLPGISKVPLQKLVLVFKTLLLHTCLHLFFKTLINLRQGSCLHETSSLFLSCDKIGIKASL